MDKPTNIIEMTMPNGDVYALPKDEDNTERKLRYQAQWYLDNEGRIPSWLKHNIERLRSE